MTCVDARHLSDDSRQRTPRWGLTPVRQASLINLPGRGSLRSGIFRRQNRVVARIPADPDPAVRFILKTARGVLASRQLEVNANLGQDTIRTRLYRGHRWGPHIGMCGAHSTCSAMTPPSSRARRGSSRSRCRQSRPIHAALPACPRTLGAFTRGSGRRSLFMGDTKRDKSPAFSLKDPEGNVVSSTRLLSQGPLVVTFYRGVWCPYCNMDLRALQAALPEV
jgi:AhpC/TSA family